MEKIYREEQIGEMSRKRRHLAKGTGENKENTEPTPDDPTIGDINPASPEHTSAPNWTV
jgi:hypothetical protein